MNTLVVPAGVALLKAVTLLLVPESPKFSLVFRDDKDRALKDLARLRACTSDGLDDEFDLLQESQEVSRLVILRNVDHFSG